MSFKDEICCGSSVRKEQWVERDLGEMDLHEQFAHLWIEAQPGIMAYIRSVIPDFHISNDILHDVVIVCMKKMSDYDQSRSFKNWCIGVARNLILNYRRKNSRLWITESPEILLEFQETRERLSDELFERSLFLSQCIKKLSKRAKHLLGLRYVKEKSLVRIAEEERTTSGTLKVAMARIRASLRKCIENRMAIASVKTSSASLIEKHVAMDLADEDIDQFRGWLLKTTLNMEEFVRATHVHSALSYQLKADPELLSDCDLFDFVEYRTPASCRKDRFLPALAASLLVSAGLVFLFYSDRRDVEPFLPRVAVGKVVDLEGEVTVLKNSRSSVLTNSAPLYASDKLSIGPDGRLELACFASRGNLNVLPESSLCLAPQGDVHRVVLYTGALNALIDPDKVGAPVIFETSFAEIVVRGTAFRLATTESTTRLQMNKGLVDVTCRRNGRTISVKEGKSVIIDADIRFINPEKDVRPSGAYLTIYDADKGTIMPGCKTLENVASVEIKLSDVSSRGINYGVSFPDMQIEAVNFDIPEARTSNFTSREPWLLHAEENKRMNKRMMRGLRLSPGRYHFRADVMAKDQSGNKVSTNVSVSVTILE